MLTHCRPLNYNLLLIVDNFLIIAILAIDIYAEIFDILSAADKLSVSLCG